MTTRNVNPTVELNGPGQDPFSLSMRDVPGIGPFYLDMTYDEFIQLRQQVNEAYLNSLGYESHLVKWEDALAGDVIPSIGGKLIDVPHVLPASDNLRGYIQGVGIVDLNRNLEISVNRRIQ